MTGIGEDGLGPSRIRLLEQQVVAVESRDDEDADAGIRQRTDHGADNPCLVEGEGADELVTSPTGILLRIGGNALGEVWLVSAMGLLTTTPGQDPSRSFDAPHAAVRQEPAAITA